MEIPLHGANTSYFMVLSAFPALVLVLGLLRYTALEPGDLMELCRAFLPEALHEFAWEMIARTDAGASRSALSVSALTALWSAGRGMYGILRGLNAVAGFPEDRSWLRVRIVSAGYTLLFILVLLMTLTFHVFGGRALKLLEDFGITGLGGLRFVVLLLAQTFVFCAMYRFLPSRPVRVGACFPGAVLASLGWTAVSAGFSWYAGRFPGGMYLAVMAMVWLYVCVCIIFAGAALNRFLMER
ncbi:MAG: YihY/virulence factor BrkB family protein [Oscillospiraceae bacterium]|nr:YihY/virulence factor BrkB family protein [Oscillospiraceae bacterium]